MSPTTALTPFLERDFLAYEKHRQKDPEYNSLRLSVRRKLESIAEAVKKRAAEAGVAMAKKGGLHHPYSFNSFRVREQRAYLCRPDKDRKKLASFFGEALGKDAETHYIQPVLEVSLDDQVVEAALRIHPQAWWDGGYLKKKVVEQGEMETWCTMLKALPPGFSLRVRDWKKDWWASQVHAQNMREYFEAYEPGDSWLHLVRTLPKEDAVEMGEDGPQWCVQSLEALIPVWQWTLWSPD